MEPDKPNRYQLYLKLFRDFANKLYFTGWLFENTDQRIILNGELLAVPMDRTISVCTVETLLAPLGLPNHKIETDTYYELTSAVHTSYLDNLQLLIPFLDQTLCPGVVNP